MLTPDELFSFIDALRRDGYNLGAEHYIASQDVLLALAAQGQWAGQARGLKTLLAPILCSTPQEQAGFYERFDDWLKQNPHLIAPVPELEASSAPSPELPPSKSDLAGLARRLRPWPWMAGGLLILLAGVIAVLLATRQPPVEWRTL